MAIVASTTTPHFLHAPQRATADLYVLACVVEKCLEGYEIDRRRLGDWCIEYVYDGEGEFVSEGRTYALREGTVFCYGGSIPHRYVTSRRALLRKVWIAFNGKRAAALLEDGMGILSGAVHLATPGEVHALFEKTFAESAANDEHGRAICELLLRLILRKIAQDRSRPAVDRQDPLAKFHSCKRHIDGRFGAMRSSFEVCRINRVSPSYLCRLFKRFSDRSPHDYLLSLKLNQAAFLLRHSRYSVKEVAFQLAFNDPFTFSKAFKRVYGASPQVYRGSARKG